jgi:ATP synthase protein I
VTGGSPPSWEVVLFRASVWPTAVAGVLAAAVAGVLRGPEGAGGAAVGCVLVVLSFGLGLYVARRTRPLHPIFTMSAAMMSYLFTVTALLLVLVVVRRTGVVDRTAVGGSVLVCVLVWLAFEVRAFLGLQLLYIEPVEQPVEEAPVDADPADRADGAGC